MAKSKRKTLEHLKVKKIKSSLFGIPNSVKSSSDSNAETLLTPVRIMFSSGKTKQKSILMLKNAKKGDACVTNMLISKSDKIACLITDTNSRLLDLHNKGKIDLSGDAF